MKGALWSRKRCKCASPPPAPRLLHSIYQKINRFFPSLLFLLVDACPSSSHKPKDLGPPLRKAQTGEPGQTALLLQQGSCSMKSAPYSRAATRLEDVPAEARSTVTHRATLHLVKALSTEGTQRTSTGRSTLKALSHSTPRSLPGILQPGQSKGLVETWF